METFDSHRLQAMLDLLAESGVEEFEGFGIHVRFTENLFAKEEVATPQEHVVEHEPEPRSLWEYPELWPGGKPPSFPKAK